MTNIGLYHQQRAYAINNIPTSSNASFFTPSLAFTHVQMRSTASVKMLL